MSKRMRNLAGNKRKRKNKVSRKKADTALAMAIADASDAFVAPSAYPMLTSYIPAKQKVTLRYTQKAKFSAAAGGAGHWRFSANGCYDPDISGTGHQPRGFDQYMAMYDHFQVIGSKCRVSFVSAENPGTVGITLRDTPTVTGSYLDSLEAPADNNTFTMIASQQEPHHLTLNYSQKKFFGTGELDNNYRGTVGANPSEQAYFHIFATDIDDLVGITVNTLVVIDYIVIFSEPKPPPQS